MNIPKKLKIGGIYYNIKQVDKISHSDEEAGLFMAEDQIIQLKKGKSEFMHQTLLHEIFHGINMELGESATEFLSQAFFQVIQDNPTLFQHNKKGGVKHVSKKD